MTKISATPKTLTDNKIIDEKYNLSKNWQKYSKIIPPKRGGSRESFSDAKNLFIRAALDITFSSKGSLRESWRVAVTMFEGNCYLCRETIYDETGSITSNGIVQADHIVSPAYGGTVTPGNMVPAHRKCNALKGDTLIEIFLKDYPERLEAISDFQKLYNYSPPAPEVFKKIIEEFSKIFDNAESAARSLAAEFNKE